MAARRLNPNRVKLHRCYSVPELADCLDVHKNTIRHWQRAGLEPIDKIRPFLFQGEMVRRFLIARNKARKQSCAPGQMYCLKCRAPREPAPGGVDYVRLRPMSGNLRASCGVCQTLMHRSTRQADLMLVMPETAVQIVKVPQRLSGCGSPSLHCDFKKRGVR